MDKREELMALAARVEALSGPDREVEIAIWRLCDPIGQKNPTAYPLPWGGLYCSSLDAALSLVPEGWEFTVGLDAGEGWACVMPAGGIYPAELEKDGYATTPALALTAAALRALAETAR